MDKLYCEFCEPDENGDICHAGEEDGCPNYSDCTAKYDIHGNSILVEDIKIKATSADIIVTGTAEKHYYEIKYREIGCSEYHIGYGSYDLNNVIEWLRECFEIVNTDER